MPMMNTPGVYIAEQSAFANSVVEVATAVPAFIGHTEFADDGATSLTGKPWRLTSMAEYTRYFGGAPQPRFEVSAITTNAAEPVLDMVNARAQSAVFAHGGTTYRLTRAAGQAGGRYLLHQAMQHFFLNGGGPCYVVSVGGFNDDIAAGDEQAGLLSGVASLLNEAEPTLIVVPDAVLLPRADCMAVQRAMLAHCGRDMKNRMAILDVWGGDRSRVDPAGDCIAHFRADIGLDHLDYAAAYYPWLHTSLCQEADMHDSMFDNLDTLAAQAGADLPPAAMGDVIRLLKTEACQMLNVMPPASAMAGIYTMVDETRGVWKAPANVRVNCAATPTVAISQAEQEDLNVTPQGKSINAIRTLTGKGMLVWGARTLDGNNLDSRYISVRRTMIMIEESCRLAAKALVFEPNAAATWVTVKSTLETFLMGLWTRGGLMGAVPQEAFSVHCGLGETMTAEDVLEGLLRVTVLVALLRPAEFIEITFQQKATNP